MEENEIISGRRSIHGRDGETPQRDDSGNEDGDVLNESQTQFTTESGSDSEGTYYKRNQVFEMSRSVPRTPQRPKRKPFAAATTSPYIPESYKSEKLSQIKAPVSKSHPKLLFILAVLFFVAASVYAIMQPKNNEEKYCSYETLMQQYPQESNWLWCSLRVGIESILNKRTQMPGVYLFLHHGGEPVHQLVKDIAAHSSSCFGKEMRPVQMESEDFISSSANDYGHAIEKYKKKIKKGNVILIANLNEIPAEAARALHTICDTHSPIAKDVVIFLTLTVPINQEGNAETIAENTLIELWAPKLGRNELDPLITRVTDQVMTLQS